MGCVVTKERTDVDVQDQTGLVLSACIIYSVTVSGSITLNNTRFLNYFLGRWHYLVFLFDLFCNEYF